MTHSKTILTLTLALLMGLMLACGGGDQSKAVKLVNESTSLMNEAVKGVKEADEKLTQLSSGNLEVEERQKQEPAVKDVLNTLEKSQTLLNNASQKVEEAGKLNVEAWFKEYVNLRQQLLRKASEQMDGNKEMAKLFMDYSITDEQEFREKGAQLEAKILKVFEEFKEIAAKVSKIETDNKDKFKE